MNYVRSGMDFVQPGNVVLHDPHGGGWLAFQKPSRIYSTCSTNEISGLLREVQQQVDVHGLYAAGFLAYEAAPAFDAALKVQPTDGFPLAWFGLYREAVPMAAPGRPPRVAGALLGTFHLPEDV